MIIDDHRRSSTIIDDHRRSSTIIDDRRRSSTIVADRRISYRIRYNIVTNDNSTDFKRCRIDFKAIVKLFSLSLTIGDDRRRSSPWYHSTWYHVTFNDLCSLKFPGSLGKWSRTITPHAPRPSCRIGRGWPENWFWVCLSDSARQLQDAPAEAD